MAKAASTGSQGLDGSCTALRTPGPGSDAYRRASGLAREVARLAREILAPSVEVIWFGSWPRGRAHERSDIDLAIRASEPIRRDRLRRLRDAVDELPTLYSIDVLDLRDASPLLREEIERDGTLLAARPDILLRAGQKRLDFLDLRAVGREPLLVVLIDRTVRLALVALAVRTHDHGRSEST